MPNASPRQTRQHIDIPAQTTLAAVNADFGEQEERRAANARARAERAALRAAARAVPPECDEGYAHLSLSEMRAHRHDVAQAEERVGYWHRVANHRLDAMRGLSADLDIARMDAELAVKALEHTRTKLMRATRRSLPAIPAMAPVWAPVDAPKAAAALEKTIAALSIYHDALISTTKAATAELIARYRQTPSDCLKILPA